MGGLTVLRKIQGGVESSLGAEVSATAVWRFEGVLEDLTKVLKAPEAAGIAPGLGRTYIPAQGGRMKMTGLATYQQLLYTFLAGIDGTVTGSQDGTGPYVYTFNFFTTTAKTPKTYTIEAGNNQQEEQMYGSFVEQFVLKGGADEGVMLETTWRGTKVEKGTFTAALSATTVNDLLFNKASIYIDAADGTVGSTVKSSTLVDLSLAVDTGFQALQAADGTLYYAAVKQVAPKIVLNATFEHDATSVAIGDNWRSETGNLVRLKFLGPTANPDGTTYHNQQLIFDASYRWMDVKALTTKNGDDLLQVQGEAYFNTSPTPDLFAQVILVNHLSAPA